MAKDTPSARTKRMLESQGFIVAQTETRNWYAGPPGMKCEMCGKNKVGKTKDLYGIADHMAFKGGTPGCCLVQSTSGSNHAARREKILANEVARAWVEDPDRSIIIVSWTKKKKKRKDGTCSEVKEWTPKIEIITEEMFA